MAVRRQMLSTMLPVLLFVAVASCTGGKRDTLTTERAEQAVQQWTLGAFICRCNGPCTASGGSPVKVTGVQELPQENSAKAILMFEKAPINHSCPGERIYSGPGEAIFSHFTDGRWVLSSISTSEQFNGFTWKNLNIDVK